MNLSDIRVSHSRITVDGTEYIVTTGTGEMGYGDRGGSAAFAYLAADVDAMEQVEDYSAFCDRATTEEDRDLAIALAAREGLRLTRAGACQPVLTDDEWDLIRATVAALS